MTYIKTLIILTGLALLTACAGGVTINPTVNNNTIVVPCETNPYGATCTGTEINTRRREIITDCRADDSGELCDDATTFVCTDDPEDRLCDDIKEYVDQREVVVVMKQCTKTKAECDREALMMTCGANPFATGCEADYGDQRKTACQTHGTDAGGHATCAASLASSCTITDPFAYAGCKDVEGIARVRTMYCQTPATAWDAECMDTTHGAVSVTRLIACQMFGTNTDTGGHATCAPSLASFCTITDPFAYAGCKDVAEIARVRMMYCQTPATAWDAECMETTHGAVDATRVMACQMFGTDTDSGGDDSCATSLTTACDIRDPFAYTGCNNVAGIARVRMMYCETPAKAWDEECMETTHGAVNTTRVTACQMFGTGTGGDDSCATSLASSCTITDPFIYAGCDDVTNINADIRTPYCQTPATAWDGECMDTTHGAVSVTRLIACQMFGTNTDTGGHATCAPSLASFCTITDPFAYAGCKDVAEIARVRMMYCQTPATAWDEECMDITHGTVDATRVTACEMFGTNTSMGGDDSCKTSLTTACDIRDPFAYTGCNNVAGIARVRMMYCETPAKAWDEECMETTHGAVNTTRVTACQMFGTGTGGDDSCATSLASSCTITDPFAYTGCKDVAGIAEVRVMYCETLTTAWDAECMQTIHGDVTIKRGDACLKFGTDTNAGGHRSCVGNTLAESSCRMNPFDPANPGCAILTKFEMIVRTYCKPNHLAGCPTATYDAWVASFPDNSPLLASNIAPTAGNKFLQGTETGLNTTGLRDFTADSFNFQTATYNGIGFGGNATEGVAFQYGNIGGKRYFYAGLLSGTDLGPPLTAVTNATWYGRIVVLQNRAWYGTAAGKIYGDIDLTVNYDGNNNGTIHGSYGEYTVNGTFDSKGIMGGNVTRSKTHTYTRLIYAEEGSSVKSQSPPYNFTRSIVGPLTGLIGQTEAVGVFIGQDFTNYDDRPRQLDANLNNFKFSATKVGFAGGFIARSTQPTN